MPQQTYSFGLKDVDARFGPPPLGPAPTWTNSDFDSPSWTYVDPVGNSRVIDFDSIPECFRLNAKIFLWALEYVTDQEISRNMAKAPPTFAQYFFLYRGVAREADALGHKLLADMSEDEVYRYLARTLRDEVKDVELTASVAQRTLVRLRKLWLMGPSGKGVIPDGLGFEISLDITKVGIPFRENNGSTLLMPDEIAIKTLETALDFLKYGKHMIFLINLESEYRAWFHAQGYTMPANARLLMERRLIFIDAKGNHAEVLAAVKALKPIFPLSDIPEKSLTEDLPCGVYGPVLAMMQPIRTTLISRYLFAACYCVVAGFTGFRGSEILSMRKDDVLLRGSRAIVRTFISKTVKIQRGAWVERVGPPIIHEAFSLMKDLAEAYNSKTEHVWVTTKGKLLTTGWVSDYLHRFLIDVVGIDDWRLTTHQFRRYFAVFYMRRFQGSVDALRRHFRYVSYSMIEHYIETGFGAQYLVKERREFVHEIIRDLTSSKPKYRSNGKLSAEQMMDYYMANNLPVREIGRQFDKYLDDVYNSIEPTPWGYCVLQRDESVGARCGSKNGVPQQSEVHPGNCGGCRYLVTGPENVEFWQHTRAMHLEVIDSSHSTRLLKATSATAVAYADNILDRLQGSKVAG